MSKKKTTRRRGGFAGFIVGLLAATASIAGILYMLERNSERDFKEPEMVKSSTPATEVLTPTQAKQASLPETDEGIDHSALTDGEVVASMPAQAVEEPVAVVPKTKPTHSSEKNKSEPSVPNHHVRQPDAEQILNSGSIEKAKEQAQREAQRAERALTQGNHSAAAKPQAVEKKSSSNQKATIQAGSYSKRATAEEQRAKLALLGVDSEVKEAEVNGRTVYRVQSAKLSTEQAEQIAKKLNSNGINTQIRQH